jgi:5-formyltetrahydrofolate cyclo-ligase
VDDLATQLERNNWGIEEPIPTLCTRIDPADIQMALIPAIAFDQAGHRLGYGKGYYDRLLPQLHCPCYGIGFTEQLVPDSLPVEPHDVALTGLILV